MRLPADEIGEGRRQRLLDEEVVEDGRDRPRDDDDEGHPGEGPAVVGEHRRRARRLEQVDDRADVAEDRHLDQRHDEADRHQREQHRPHLARVVPVEAERASAAASPRRAAGRDRSGSRRSGTFQLTSIVECLRRPASRPQGPRRQGPAHRPPPTPPGSGVTGQRRGRSLRVRCQTVVGEEPAGILAPATVARMIVMIFVIHPPSWPVAGRTCLNAGKALESQQPSGSSLIAGFRQAVCGFPMASWLSRIFVAHLQRRDARRSAQGLQPDSRASTDEAGYTDAAGVNVIREFATVPCLREVE